MLHHSCLSVLPHRTAATRRQARQAIGEEAAGGRIALSDQTAVDTKCPPSNRVESHIHTGKETEEGVTRVLTAHCGSLNPCFVVSFFWTTLCSAKSPKLHTTQLAKLKKKRLCQSSGYQYITPF